ncbi:hypothetical protein CTAYLR_002887 [Chrysophaeum taylorii]|uniref:Uncharacterized protein n=1 Tax=Chrysophaeum taylorii TaxID=2483200 RepID=A0AAD7UNI8_9STRA|nr:hypothetical protein CTAYLR_002887 [Chrysophaeum taylorii]
MAKLVKALRTDVHGALLAWSGRECSADFDDWKSFWRERELSLLHHAPYRLENCPPRKEWTEMLFETARAYALVVIIAQVLAELTTPLEGLDDAGRLKFRVGVVFALYTFYNTQPEPVAATKERARRAGENENEKDDEPPAWRVPVPVRRDPLCLDDPPQITPGTAFRLMALRRELVDAKHLDGLRAMRGLLDLDARAVELLCADDAPPAWTSLVRAPIPRELVAIPRLESLASDYERALARLDGPALRPTSRAAGLAADLDRILILHDRGAVQRRDFLSGTRRLPLGTNAPLRRAPDERRRLRAAPARAGRRGLLQALLADDDHLLDVPLPDDDRRPSNSNPLAPPPERPLVRTSSPSGGSVEENAAQPVTRQRRSPRNQSHQPPAKRRRRQRQQQRVVANNAPPRPVETTTTTQPATPQTPMAAPPATAEAALLDLEALLGPAP